MKYAQPGFILVMALFVISLGSILVTSLLQRSIAFDRLHRVLVKKQQARMLALSGIDIARAQLSNPLEIDKKTIDHNLVPFLYTGLRQTFDTPQGKIKIYIACEDGKLSLNRTYNFDEKTFISFDKTLSAQTILAVFDNEIKKRFGFEHFSQDVEHLFKKRAQPFEDLTELLPSKGDIFYDMDAEGNEYAALTDILTLAHTEFTVQPLYMSVSLARILQLDMQELDKNKRLEIIKKLSTAKAPINWVAMWKELLEALFKKEYTVLPDGIKKILASKIEVNAFNVISYGTVDDGSGMPITQKLCAYLEKQMTSEKTVVYTIKRLYWL